MSKTLDDVVEELAGIRREMVTRSDLAAELGAVRREMVTRSDLATELGAVRREMVPRSEFAAESAALRGEMAAGSAALRSEIEDLKEEMLKALAGIASQQTTFNTLLTKLLNDREEADRRFARLEAAVFGSKH